MRETQGGNTTTTTPRRGITRHTVTHTSVFKSRGTLSSRSRRMLFFPENPFNGPLYTALWLEFEFTKCFVTVGVWSVPVEPTGPEAPFSLAPAANAATRAPLKKWSPPSAPTETHRSFSTSSGATGGYPSSNPGTCRKYAS